MCYQRARKQFENSWNAKKQEVEIVEDVSPPPPPAHIAEVVALQKEVRSLKENSLLGSVQNFLVYPGLPNYKIFLWLVEIKDENITSFVVAPIC